MSKIIITNFHGYNPIFENLKPNTTHDVVDVKHNCIWVRGIGADVMLYPNEYKWVEQTVLTLPDGHTYQFWADEMAPSPESCRKCAFAELCNANFIFPCWYKARDDGRNGHFVTVL